MSATGQAKFLKVSGLNAFYGKSHILFDMDLSIDQKGQSICLMGRNGAGKTTTLLALMGWIRGVKGSVRFRGKEVVRQKPHRLARLGFGLVPEDRRIFADLTVGENLKLGLAMAKKWDRQMVWDQERIFNLFPMLKESYNRPGGDLSGGMQQMLTIGRTLAMNPDLLLLDEPSEGLAPIVVKEMAERLLQVKDAGMTMIITEQQHLQFVRKLAEVAYIIDKGQIKYSGSVEEILENQELKKKYLAV